MRQITFHLLLFLSVLNIGAQNITLEGKLIIANSEDLEIAKNEVQVYLVSCEPDRIVDVKDDLTFKFQNLNAGDYELMFLPFSQTNYLDRSIHIDSVKSTVKIDIDYFYKCRYNISKNNKTCPKCKKQNRVIPIKYGFFISSNNSQDYWPGGCIIFNCQPHWYCKRDKIEF